MNNHTGLFNEVEVGPLLLETRLEVLELTDEDYNQNGMSDLLALNGSSYDINIQMFNRLQHSITGWPGGKPNSDDNLRSFKLLVHTD